MSSTPSSWTWLRAATSAVKTSRTSPMSSCWRLAAIVATRSQSASGSRSTFSESSESKPMMACRGDIRSWTMPWMRMSFCSLSFIRAALTSRSSRPRWSSVCRSKKSGSSRRTTSADASRTFTADASRCTSSAPPSGDSVQSSESARSGGELSQARSATGRKTERNGNTSSTRTGHCQLTAGRRWRHQPGTAPCARKRPSARRSRTRSSSEAGSAFISMAARAAWCRREGRRPARRPCRSWRWPRRAASRARACARRLRP